MYFTVSVTLTCGFTGSPFHFRKYIYNGSIVKDALDLSNGGSVFCPALLTPAPLPCSVGYKKGKGLLLLRQTRFDWPPINNIAILNTYWIKPE